MCTYSDAITRSFAFRLSPASLEQHFFPPLAILDKVLAIHDKSNRLHPLFFFLQFQDSVYCRFGTSLPQERIEVPKIAAYFFKVCFGVRISLAERECRPSLDSFRNYFRRPSRFRAAVIDAYM